MVASYLLWRQVSDRLGRLLNIIHHKIRAIKYVYIKDLACGGGIMFRKLTIPVSDFRSEEAECSLFRC